MSYRPRFEIFGNSVESWLNKQINARIIFDKIKTAISLIKYPYCQILETGMLDGMNRSKFQYSPRQLMHKRDLVFLQFADTFADVHDFHMYQ